MIVYTLRVSFDYFIDYIQKVNRFIMLFSNWMIFVFGSLQHVQK